MTTETGKRPTAANEYDHQAALVLVERLLREGRSEREIVRELRYFGTEPAHEARRPSLLERVIAPLRLI